MCKDVKARRGLRCRICTGCGLCPGVAAGGDYPYGDNGSAPHGLQVLTENLLAGGGALSGESGRRLAVADIGTTTIALLLYGKDGSVEDRYVALNPQARYGADVLSRIRAAENPADRENMRQMVLEVLEQGIARFRERLEGQELLLALAGNTTMIYLLRGLNPAELGRAPFRAEHLEAVSDRLGADRPGGVDCFIFPGLSAFVGGDITAGLLACGMAEREELTLLIDLGTNGEMVLGNRHGRIACATAAGPAFEGGANRGIWGSDMISLLAILRREGIVDETGLLQEPYFDRGIRIGNVLVTQASIRSVQLAKAAIAAGVEILLEKYGAAPGQIDRVVLAGGFGYYLNPRAAAEIGLFPAELTERTIVGGNTALGGCLRAGQLLLARKGETLLEKLEDIKSGTRIINLAAEPEFQEKYVQRMEMKKIK